MKTAEEIMGLVEAYVLARCRFHDMSQSFTRQMGADVKSTGDALCDALTAILTPSKSPRSECKCCNGSGRILDESCDRCTALQVNDWIDCPRCEPPPPEEGTVA